MISLKTLDLTSGEGTLTCDSSVTGAGAEEMNSAVCMLYRPYQSVRLHYSNPPLDSTHPFRRATEYDLDHSPILRWHASMRRLDDGVCSGWFAVEQGLRQGCMFASLLFNIFFSAVINVTFTRLKADKDIMDALVHPRKKKRAGRAGGSNYRRASPADAALGHALC